MGNGGNSSRRFGDYELDSQSNRLIRERPPGQNSAAAIASFWAFYVSSVISILQQFYQPIVLIV